MNASVQHYVHRTASGQVLRVAPGGEPFKCDVDLPPGADAEEAREFMDGSPGAANPEARGAVSFNSKHQPEGQT